MKKEIAKEGTKLGIEFALIIVICTLIGYFLGKWTISAVGGMIIGAFIGFLGTIFLAFNFLKRYRNKKR